MFIIFKPDGSFTTIEVSKTPAKYHQNGDILFNKNTSAWFKHTINDRYKDFSMWASIPDEDIPKHLQLSALLISN